MKTINEKYADLQDILRGLGSVAVAFSGGVDSTFLLRTAHDVLGDKAVAVTISSVFVPGRELDEAERFCRENGIRQIVFHADELAIPGIRENPPDRCYLCKKALFSKIRAIAAENGLAAVAEGSNTDDEGDYRPGMRAIRELDVKSPLRQAGLGKEEIRSLSKRLGLPTWNKPSYACLASRFAYGEPLDEKRLSMVEQAEQLLLDLGFQQMRVRVHGMIARIEVPPEDFPAFLREETRKKVSGAFRELGFRYTALDLQGYRVGSMNEALSKETLKEKS